MHTMSMGLEHSIASMSLRHHFINISTATLDSKGYSAVGVCAFILAQGSLETVR